MNADKIRKLPCLGWEKTEKLILELAEIRRV